jgi:flagellar biogenesis protein FliO
MAVRTRNLSRAPGARAYPPTFASALIALSIIGVGANAQTMGPIANFGPASIDVETPPRPLEPAIPAAPAQNLPAQESRPLLAPGPTKAAPATLEGDPPGVVDSAGPSWLRVVGALAIVLAIIFAVRVAVRRVATIGGLRGQFGAAGRAPSGVLEVLGRYPISRGQSLVLLRVDQRVLLLSQSGSGFRTLANFDEPSDVASLLMRTRDDQSESLSGKFRQMLSAFERDPSMTRGVEHIDLTRRAPLAPHRAQAHPAPAVQRVATPRDAQDAIRKRLATLREATA